MQKEFRPLIEEAIGSVKEYFNERFLAAYLHGSLYYGDAIPNISDLDGYIVIRDNFSDTDKAWIRDNANKLQEKYPIINGVHLSVHSVEDVKKDAYTRFILKYNSSLYDGVDIAEMFNTKEFGFIQPDKNIAKERLPFAKQCFSDALSGKQPECTGELPKNTYYIARKFARYFIIIEGAYFLMAMNRFHSFQKEQVLMDLRENCPEFDDVLNLAEKILQNPVEVGVTHEKFLMEISPLMQMMFESISNR